ncbi:MAG TPA: hypothetical protein VFW94_24400 [Candidatus Acidoferrales bacterium]|nr:hypothetical protein [Candidatus Acidoferrales bacterium]
MQLTLLKGYPDMIGLRRAFAGYGNGPSNYTQGADDPVTIPTYGFSIDALFGGVISTDGSTVAMAHPSGSGSSQTWNLQYYVASSMARASGDLSGKVFQIAGFGGF